MPNAESLFPAESQQLRQVLHRGGASFGYKIPDYQRPYSWNTSELKRLVDDSLARFLKLPHDESTFNFLGTIIMADDQIPESNFTGQSHLVVDGQQRLISLALLCSVMAQLVFAARQHYEPKGQAKRWIQLECQDIVDQLFACSNGTMHSGIDDYIFPRITRSTDRRSSIDDDFFYGSDIADFLWQFARYYTDASRNYSGPFEPNADRSTSVLVNYRYLYKQLRFHFFLSPELEPRYELECPRLEKSQFRRRGMKNLFQRLNVVGGFDESDRMIARICRSERGATLLRIILFARFLLERLIITKIETNTEDQAFDIFDALNTTGLPLTAVETLKPLVTLFERSTHQLEGAQCRERFDVVEDYLNDPRWSSAARQTATKDVVTGFALYYEGKRLGFDLSAQRQYLRNTFEGAKKRGDVFALEHSTSLAEIAEFRNRFWRSSDITEIGNINVQNVEEMDELLLCLAFVRNANSKLAIPILTTYWRRSMENREISFPAAAKSVAAFIALRRTMTGGTARIDDKFRDLMKMHHVCRRDVDPGNASLNRSLVNLLESDPHPIVSKKSWINRSKTAPLNAGSRAVAKFMLLAASDNSVPQNNGLWARGSRFPSDDAVYLSHSIWASARYKTLEHIAPSARNVSGWDATIYADPSTCELLGNLVLLPQKENSSLGKASWKKKKAFYAALAAEDPKDRQRLIAEAQGLGVDFSPQTIKLIAGQERLRMLDSIVRVDRWTEDLIRSRTENILDLSWEAVAPWIFES